MDPRPCLVVDGPHRWPGQVLAWRRQDNTWLALVRFSRDMPQGYPLTFEHWLPADELVAR